MKTIFNLLLSICMVSTLSSQFVIESEIDFEVCVNKSQTTEWIPTCTEGQSHSVLTIGKNFEKVSYYINGDTEILDVVSHGRYPNDDKDYVIMCTLEGDPFDYIIIVGASSYEIVQSIDGDIKVVLKHQVKKATRL